MAKDDDEDDVKKKKSSGDEGEDGDEAPKKGKKMLIIIIAAAVLLLGGVGAGLYFFTDMFKGSSAEGEAPKEEAKAEGEHGEKAEGEHGEGATAMGIPGQPVFYNLPEFLVNLSTDNKGTSFLKMAVTLELSSAQDQPIVEANLPRIVDGFNTYLRELRASDLSGSAGIYRLREELLLRINKTLYPVQVKDILFKEIIVQ